MRKFLYIALLVLGFGVVAQDPIAHYTFAGNALDQSGKGNDGTIIGATLSNDRFGNGNSAYFFDGVNDYVSTAQTFSNNQPISVSMWVYWNGTSGDQTAISWFDGALSDQMFFGVNGSGLLVFGNGFQTGTSLESSRWVHLAATYDGNQSRIYIDGNQSDVSETGLTYQFGNLVIGRQGTNSSEYWNGNIDDIRIYDQSLSASEVEALYYEGAFITTWETTSDNEQITIPINEAYSYNYTVDWGDGNVIPVNTGSVSHTYTTAGTYTVSIFGDFPAINFSNPAANGSQNQIQSVEQWGDINWLDFTDAFNGCSNMVINALDAPDLTNVTSLFAMFASTNFSADLSNWDVSTITDMGELFAGSTFNGNISTWNVFNVTAMNSMFLESNFSGDISGWEVDKVTTMVDMFRNSSFNGDISGWNVENVVVMTRMFWQSQFNQDISGWNPLSLNFSISMFLENEEFNQDISGWNMSNVLNMASMFSGASSFNQNLSSWDISSVTNMNSIFDNSGMSILSYDSTLIGWSTLSGAETQINSGLTLGASGVSYCNSSVARDELINTYSWTISGDVMDCPDLIAEFLFDGNALDNSDYGYNGTVFEAELSTDRFGNENSAYRFDGENDKISVAVTNQMPTNLTMSAWFYFPEGAGDATHQILEIDGAAVLAVSNNQFQVLLNMGGTFELLETPVPHSEWNLGTFTYDGTTLRGYLNGSLFAELENAGGIEYLNASSPINIGMSAFSGSYFNGGIDDVIIHGRALTDSEISDLYTDRSYVSERTKLTSFYNALDGDNWINNNNWNTEASIAEWNGIYMSNGLVSQIVLSNNNLTGEIPSEVSQFTNLINLTLLSNNLSGNIPVEIGNMSSLLRLHLSNNQLSGTIPTEFGNLSNLLDLYLSLNNLTGELPSSLGNLSNLRLLTVSRNELSGAIPPELSNIPNPSTGMFLYSNNFTSLPDLTALPVGTQLSVYDNQIGFEDLIANLPIQSTDNFVYSPQTADGEEILTVVNTEEVTLTTSESTLGTNYQWYFNGDIIDGATSQDYLFTYDASLEGTYYVQMTNDNLPDGIINRASYIVRDEVNTSPTDVTMADGAYDGVLKEGVPIGTLVTVLETIDADPVDTYNYTFATGPGDGFNSSFTISNDSVFTAVEMDPIAAPVHQFRVRSTDSGGEFVENTFIIQVSPIQVCNYDVLTASSGTFDDGSSQFDYENNFSCSWLIELSPESQVRLSFTEFDTEENFDFVRVYDGADETGTLLAQLSGNEIPEMIVSSSNTMFITFISDALEVSSGWSASYSQLTPVADYPFTDGSTDDVSGYGNNIITNKAFASSDRLGSGAYYFDGSTSFMQAPSTLSGSNVPFTISTWIRWDGNDSDFTEIVSWWNTSSTSKVYLGTSAGSNELRFGDGYGATGAFIPANEWVHVAATYDGSVASIYINGTLSANSAAGVTQDFGGGDLFIGKQGTNESEFFGGIIDDLKIYDIALSASEINNLYSSTSTSLIAYLPFSNGFEDTSSNGHDATDLGSGNVFISDRLGIGSNAFDFDIINSGALEVSSFANYNFGDEITVMGWIRPDTYPANDIQLFNNSFLSGSGFEFRLVKEDLSDDSKRKLFAGVTGISYGNSGDATISIDEWTHVAFKFKRGEGTSLFVNGENLVSYGFIEGTNDLPIPLSTDGIYIGEGFDGAMDEIKIFDSALSDQQILGEYTENLWPFHSLAFRGPEGGGGITEDRQLALSPSDPSSYLGAVYLYFDGDYQFRATSDAFEAFMGDNELDGIAEPGSTQLALEGGFHAVGFRQSNFEYFVERITSVGIIGSALTGDNSGWNSDLDLMNLNESVYQIRNIRLYDGEFKLRINDAWDYIDWGSNDLDGNLDYRGSNIPISAGIYTLSFDLHNNKYTIIDLSSNEAVAELDFSGNTLDDSGYENNGSSTSTTYTTGRFDSENTAIVLDGASGVNLGNDPSLNLTNGFTMNIWINPTDNESGSELFASGGSFHNHLYATEVAWRYFQNEVEIGIDGIYIEAPVDTWTMITWTYDGGAMRFYDDGVLVYTEEVYGDIDVNANSYVIGSNFNGAVDAFQWIDGVLSDKEIQYLYTDNLIVDYALDGNTDDQSGNEIHGFLPNGGTYIDDRFGNVTVALSLDGANQYIEVDNANKALITGNEITFEGWFQANSLTDGAFLLSSPGIIAFIDDAGVLGFAPQTTEVSYYTESSVAVGLDEWFHFAGTYDGATTKIYVNGVETASEQIDQEMNISFDGTTTIGGNGSSNFAGFLDDVSIYNYALNAEEIAEIYGENDFALPVISGLFPNSGAPGSTIRVYGKNFNQIGTSVFIGGAEVTPNVVNDKLLYFTIPDVGSGAQFVSVSNNFDTSLSHGFTVLNSNESTISFEASNLITTGVNTPVELHTADLNGDGFPDLLAASHREGNITTYLNNADGTFDLPTTIFTSSNTGSLGLTTIRSGDLDQDGDIDIVTTYLNNLYWFENDGTGTFLSTTLISQLSTTDYNYRDVQLGDINGDATLDIVVTNNNGGTIDWFSNDGNGSFSDEGIISSSPSAYKLSLNDFDNDGDLDIAQANASNFILLNDGFGVFNRTDLTSTAANGYNAVITADFNNDDLIDMVAGSQNDNNVDVYLNGVGDPVNIYQSGDGVSAFDFSIGDIDGDGDTDLITAFFGGNLTIYLNDGNAGFTAQIVDSNVASLSRVSAIDIDNDGDLDLFASRQSGEISWYENQIPSDQKEILSFDLSIGATPSETDFTYIGEFEGSRYYLSTASQTWTDAKTTAESLGGHLATIHSQEENDFISATVESAWLGGSDEVSEGTFRWADNTPFDYTNWGGDEPNGNTDENYTQLIDNGTWNDFSNELLPFVVEIPSFEGLVNATTATVAVEVPFGTDVSSLVAYFDLSSGAFAESNEVLQESGVTVNDFTSGLDYLVTAEDGSFKNWSVSLTVDNGLLAAYSFSGNSADESGNGISLMLDGAISIEDRFGNENAAYSFDGDNDQLTRSNTDLLGGEYEASLVFWANPSRNEVFQDLVNFGNIRAFSDESGRLKFQLFTEGSSGTYDAELEAGVWQQFVLTYDKDSIRVYKDAVLTDKVEKYGAIDSNGLLLVIGSSSGNDFYQGGLDDVQLFNRALSEDEILSLFNENGWPPLSTETDILSFSVPNERGEAVIDPINHTVDILVDFNADLTSTTPTFALSEGAIAIVNDDLQISGSTVIDFTNPLTYSVTAEDNTTTQDWLVTLERDSVQGDSLALVALYNATDGDNWSTSWDLSGPMSSWEGLTFNSEGRVTSIILNENNLTGTLPAQIGNLTELLLIHLEINNLSGSIPSSLGNLSNLRGLHLYNNQFTGSIPSGLGNLSSLFSVLELSANLLTGSIPSSIGNLSGLKSLNLAGNNLTGSIPTQLGNLTELNALHLSDNSLSGVIPEEIGLMTSLNFMSLNNNQLSGTIPSTLGDLVNLTSLGLEGNRFTGNIPSEIGNLTSLIELHLGGNRLSGEIPISFANLLLLESLGLEYNLLSSIPNLTSVAFTNEGLGVSNNKIGFADIITNLSITNFYYANQVVEDTVRVLISDTYKVYTKERTENTNYQWYKDDVLIEGATDSTYLASEAGRYHVAMTNSDVGIENLTITRAPFILTGADATDFISFSFDGIDAEGIIDLNLHEIEIEVPFGTSLDNAIPVFELSPGASADIGGSPQTSGSGFVNFESPITYTITAQDGITTQDWIVSASIGLNQANDIENFDIADMIGNEVIDLTNHTVNITMPYNTNRASLTPFIAVSANATISPDTNTEQDFSTPFTYSVTSESGLEQEWLVSVTNQLNNETDILNFDIPNQVVAEVIDTDNHTVVIQMPFGTDVTSLTPTILLSAGATVSPQSGIAQNFTNAVIYTVIPEDNSASQQWTVTVEVDPNPNNVPTSLQLSSSTIDENSLNVIGGFSNNDPDSDTFIYSLINGIGATDNSSFSITGTELYPQSTFDFETKVSYSILVRVDDQRGGKLDRQFTITVTDVNEAPQIADQNFSIDENSNDFVLVGTVVASDEDAGASLSFSITNGNTGNAFGIDNNGNITVANQSQLDYETNPAFSLTVNVSDGTLSDDAIIAINLNDLNENSDPTAIGFVDGNNDIPENESVGYGLVLETFDADGSDSHTYSLVSGTGDSNNDLFSIVSNQLQSTSVFDFESATQYSVRVQTDDGNGGLFSQELTIDIINVNEAPIIADQTYQVDENTGNGLFVANVSASDPELDAMSYEIVSGNGSGDGAFTINSTTGELIVNDVSQLDAESTAFFNLTVSVSDGEPLSNSAIITVNLINAPDPTSFSLAGNPTSSAKEDFQVSATIIDQDGITSVKLYTKKVGGSSFASSANIIGSNDVYTQTINGATSMDNIGVEYYFEMEDEFGTERSDTLIVSSVIADGSKNVNGKFSAGTTVQDYSLLAFPFKSVSIQNAFGTIGAYQEDWRLVIYQNGALSDKSSGNTSAGIGYWFITKNESATVSVGGESVDLSAEGAYRINLSPDQNGYSLIGNPFQATIDWSIVRAFNENNGNIGSGSSISDLIKYNSGFIPDQSSLNELEGAFVQATGVTQIDIPTSAIIGGGGRTDQAINLPGETYIDDRDWKLDLFFNTPSYSYSAGGVGMNIQANDDNDGYDLGLLPRLELYLEVIFRDGNTRSIKRSAEFKSWNFNVRNNLSEELIDMTWDIPVSSNKTIILVDGASQKIYDLKETKSIQLKNDPSATHQLYYGDKKTIFENLDLNFDAYYGSYPNPVEDMLTIEMYGSTQRNVAVFLVSIEGKTYSIGSMKLYEGLSREIVNLDQFSIPAGIYFLKVDGEIATKILKR